MTESEIGPLRLADGGECKWCGRPFPPPGVAKKRHVHERRCRMNPDRRIRRSYALAARLCPECGNVHVPGSCV